MEYFWRSASSSNSSAHAAEISIPLVLVSDITKEALPTLCSDKLIEILVFGSQLLKGSAGIVGRERLVGKRQGGLLVVGVDRA